MRNAPLLLSLGLLSSSFVLLACHGQQGMAKPAIAPPPPPPIAAQVKSPAASSAASAPQVGADYILGAQDTIMVTVWKEPTLSGPLIIRPDGMISIPLIGDLAASGVAPMQLAGNISEKLKKFITDPTVTVIVTGVNSKRIYFIGEVGRAGPMEMTPNMTMLQAISSAGGLSPYADAKHIRILRGNQGKQQTIYFDYKKALKGDEQGVVLLPGDTIWVK